MIRWLGVVVGDITVGGPHAPRVGAGKPRTAAATRRVEGAPASAAANGHGPNVLGFTVEAMAELAGFAADRTGGDRGRLASAGISPVLGLEESAPIRSARYQHRTPRSNSTDEPR